MPKLDTLQTNFTAGEMSPRLKGRVDIARYQNGAEIVENGVPVVHGGVDRRDGTRFCAAAKLNEDRGAIVVPYVYNTDQSFALEFGHQYIRFFTSTGAVILNAGLAPLELASPYTRDQLAALTFTQKADTLLVFHPNVPTQRLRRLSATSWSIQPVPWVTEPFAEVGHTPDWTIGLSSTAVGAGRTFTAAQGTVPGAPTIDAVTPFNGSANVAFTAPASNGGSAVTNYVVTSSPGGLTGSGASSPVRVSGLTNGVAYTFTVVAQNAIGTGPASASSAAATPLASLPSGALTVTATPLDISRSVPNGRTAIIAGATASASGGTGSTSYQWSVISASPGLTLEVTNQSQMSYRSTGYDEENFGSFRCLATDLVTGASGTAAVNVTVSHFTRGNLKLEEPV